MWTDPSSIMLVRALLQTSLVLWLAQQSLQGGVNPQSVSWGRVLPARGVGIGVKPGVTGALGALGSRYGNKAMKTGIGRYSGAQLGAGGYRSLGLGGRAGLKQGGYGNQGAYGASLGTGMGLGAGLTNGLGLGQAGKRAYGAGLGTYPGYGSLGGIGYPARPGVPAEHLVGPEMASQGQAVQDLNREKSRGLDLYGKQDRMHGPEMPDMRSSNINGPIAPELHAGREVKRLDPTVQPSSLRHRAPLDERSKILELGADHGESSHLAITKRKVAPSHEATLEARNLRRQLPVEKDNIQSLGSSSQIHSNQDFDSSNQQNQRVENCGFPINFSDVLKINRFELLDSEIQSSVPQLRVDEEGRHVGTSQTQREKTSRLPVLEAENLRAHVHSTPGNQRIREYFAAVQDRQGIKGLVAKNTNRIRIRGTVMVQQRRHSATNLQVQGGGHDGAGIPGASGTQSVGVASNRADGQEAPGFIGDGQSAKQLSQNEYEIKKSKAPNIPGQTGRNAQTSSYIGGAGSYLGASLGPLGYGAGLGQGAYLGGAAGKLGAATALGQGGYPQGAAGKSTGYGDGATGYLGAVAGNGLGYGNGDGYGAGLAYPAELADGAEKKAGRSEALSTGGYAGPVQGGYGALGAGLEPTGGKYGGGAAQVPYGNAPVVPAGLEGDGGYPYAAQQLGLGAESAKSASKYGAAGGYGAQQAGFGVQLGAAQDALGEQNGKYDGVNPALGNGYKG
ncbi:fibroin heavy chain [Archocentrus centrarchus]|uniref:fibroin heavy chain n=1 Tax=Archocentrus centrarchus TaxID=63155 RepID=UPI0011EA1D32|nr:fibroin heavy chain-like [Archocentrus centrarchus]